MKPRQILTLIIGSFLFTACSSSSKTVSCSTSEYATYYYNNSQNTACGEKYQDGTKLYGFGDMRGSEGQDEMLKRVAHTKAVSEVAQKAAAIQNKIKGSMGEVITQNADGESKTERWFQSQFEVRLTQVSVVGETCENSSTGYKCYVLVEMPKSALLENASASLQKQDETLYQQWVNSEEYKELLAELR